MRKIWYFLIGLLLTCRVVDAYPFARKDSTGQKSELEPAFLLGIDLLKTFSYTFLDPLSDRGYHMELNSRYVRRGKMGFMAALGYATLEQERLKENVDYKGSGWFVKLGLEYNSLRSRRRPGAGLSLAGAVSYARFQNEAAYFIPGNYYQSHHQFSRFTGHSASIQVFLPYRFYLAKPLLLALEPAVSYVFRSGKSNSLEAYPNYFIPGTGVMLNNSITAGFTIQLFYLISQ